MDGYRPCEISYETKIYKVNCTDPLVNAFYKVAYMILQGVALVNASALVKSIYKGIDAIALVKLWECIYKGVILNHVLNQYLQGRSYIYKENLRRDLRDL